MLIILNGLHSGQHAKPDAWSQSEYEVTFVDIDLGYQATHISVTNADVTSFNRQVKAKFNQVEEKT